MDPIEVHSAVQECRQLERFVLLLYVDVLTPESVPPLYSQDLPLVRWIDYSVINSVAR